MFDEFGKTTNNLNALLDVAETNVGDMGWDESITEITRIRSNAVLVLGQAGRLVVLENHCMQMVGDYLVDLMNGKSQLSTLQESIRKMSAVEVAMWTKGVNFKLAEKSSSEEAEDDGSTRNLTAVSMEDLERANLLEDIKSSLEARLAELQVSGQL